jgi:hypothetical protein
VELGFFTLPCEGKRPVGVGWQNRTDPFEIPFQPWHNVGIKCGDGGLFAIDIDIDDEKISASVAAPFVREGALVRFGRAPRRLLVMRAAEGIPKSRDLKYQRPDGQKFTVQLLGKGKQFIAFGTHPDTLQPYRWEGASLLDRHCSFLPVAHV